MLTWKWIFLHGGGGHGTLALKYYAITIIGVVVIALLMKYFGIIDAISGMFVAGKNNEK